MVLAVVGPGGGLCPIFPLCYTEGMTKEQPTIKSPALTAEYVQALNAVDLQLLGVDHGTYESDRWTSRARGLTDEHYAVVANAVGALQPKRGDMLAIEPAGFKKDQMDYRIIEDIVPLTGGDRISLGMSSDDRRDMAGVFKDARRTFRTNNFVYGAAAALLRGVPVRRADASRPDFKRVADLLPYLTPEEGAYPEMKLYYRSNQMLASLGNIAVDMVDLRRMTSDDDSERPVLLSLQCPQHTPRLADLLHNSGVTFQISMPMEAGQPTAAPLS